ncbi:MAG TPA: hypothetical protein ENN67_04865 [Firmicutes bacterium]|nr:hypothetical protein [Bacillota bacterium]
MLNPDGYTRWWNANEFTDPLPIFSFKPGKMGNDSFPSATLNPYKYYSDDLAYSMDVKDMTISNRGVFRPTGQSNTRLYKIQFPVIGSEPSLVFSYAVDASWEPPDPMGAPNYPIEFFGPGAQCKEAYHLVADFDNSTMWYDNGSFGGEMILELEVFDWQGAVNPSGVPAEVSAIWIESPILTSPVNIYPTAVTSPGSQITSSVFEAEIQSSNLSIPATGDYPVLITVESATPSNYQPQLDGGEGYIFPDVPLAAYTMAFCTVETGQPYVPADDVTGDVILRVTRNSSDTITGIELEWTDNGSPYYAIYADDNPYDGLNPAIFVTEISSIPAQVNSSVWPDFSTNGAYVFGVKGRTVSGVIGSESPNMSELAFVEMVDFDGGSTPSPWLEGYRNESYKWVESNPGLIDGSTSLRHNPNCPIDQWAVIAGPIIPAIPNSEMAFMEFAHIASFNSWYAYYKELSAGFTHSVPPTGTATYNDYDTTQDFYCIMDGTHDWVMPSGPPPGGGWIGLVERFGWNLPSYTFFGWRFSDCPHNNSAITRMAFPKFIDDAGTIRPALAWVTNTHNNTSDWMEIDEIAVVIY